MQERVPALIFTIRGDHYGLLQDGGASLLPWLQRYAPPGPVPGVPAWVLGLLNVHGTVQPVADLGAFMGKGDSVPGNATRLIFLEHAEVCTGLLVDSAAGIRYLDTVDYTYQDSAEPLVAGAATVQGQLVRVLDGIALINAISGALAAPAGRMS